MLIIEGHIKRVMTIEDDKKKGGLSLFAKHAVQYYICLLYTSDAADE